MIKRKAVVAATVTAAAALITLAACTWMPIAYASETTTDEAAETYHVYTVNITVDGKAYNDVTCDDTRTIWDFVNEIGINDTNDTNVTLRDENGNEISRDTLTKELDGATITTEAVDNDPQVPTEPTEQTYSITLDGKTYESTNGEQTVWEFIQSEMGVTENGNTTVTIRDENGEEVSRDTPLKDVSGDVLTLEAKSFHVPEPDATSDTSNTTEQKAQDTKYTTINVYDANSQTKYDSFTIMTGQTLREAIEQNVEPNRITYSVIEEEDPQPVLIRLDMDKKTWAYQLVNLDEPYTYEYNETLYLTYDQTHTNYITVQFDTSAVTNTPSNMLNDPNFQPNKKYQNIKLTFNYLTREAKFEGLENTDVSMKNGVADYYTLTYQDDWHNELNILSSPLEVDTETLKLKTKDENPVIPAGYPIDRAQTLTIRPIYTSQIAIYDADAHGGISYVYLTDDYKKDGKVIYSNSHPNDETYARKEIDTSSVKDPTGEYRLVGFQTLPADDEDLQTSGPSPDNKIYKAALEGTLADYLKTKNNWILS